MSDRPGGSRLNTITAICAAATAVIGLVGAAVAFFTGGDDGKARAVAAPANAYGVDQSGIDGDVPPTIDGYMSGPAFIDLWSEKRLCYRLRDDSCEMIAGLVQRGPREVRMLQDVIYPLTYPTVGAMEQLIVSDAVQQRRTRPATYHRRDQVDYLITRQGICTTPAHSAESAPLTEIFTSSSGGGGDSVSMTPSGLQAYRAQLADSLRNGAVGAQQCYRFKRVGSDQVDQFYFIDGVLQPAQTMRLSLVAGDGSMPLRPVDLNAPR